MLLNVCLVTKGREDFIQQTLDSLESSLRFDFVRVIVVDNGSPKKTADLIAQWGLRNPERVIIKRFEFNDPRPNRTIEFLRSLSVDWVIFPSDDDILLASLMEEWEAINASNAEIVAMAFGARIIEKNGRRTTGLLVPSNLSQEVSAVASAFHEPPFVWPSFAFRLTSLPTKIPNTRFIFDWWASIHLMLAGKIHVSSTVGLLYRKHQEQESNVVATERKLLEAERWLTEIVRSPRFCEWLTLQGMDKRIEFFEHLASRKPCYADPIFGRQIFTEIKDQLLNVSQQYEIQILRIFTRASGVVARDQDLFCLSASDYNTQENVFSCNFQINYSKNICPSLGELLAQVKIDKSALTIKINCKHSAWIPRRNRIDCLSLSGLNQEVKMDLVTKRLQELLSETRLFVPVLTAGERFLIRKLRTIRSKLPLGLSNALRKRRR